MKANGHGAAGSRARWGELARLLDSDAALNQSSEALMSSLRLLNGTRPLKTLLFTSAQPEEGKTTVAVVLALAMARAGKRTLLVDADLRRPRVHHILGLENAKGLVDILGGTEPKRDIVRTLEIANPGDRRACVLNVVTSGQCSNAFEVIQSASLGECIQEFAGPYDTVVIDSPPVLSVSDPLLLAALVDGVVLIVNTGALTAADATRAKQRLEQAGGRILGVVMNRFDENLHGPGFNPYQGYYAGMKSKVTS